MRVVARWLIGGRGEVDAGVGHGRVLELGGLVAVGAGSGNLAAGRGYRLCSVAAVVEGMA